jgi:hypothetical protein
MTDNNTRELSDSEKIDWLMRQLTMIEAIVLDRFDNVDNRLTTLESTVEDRFKDTRPIWQAINARTERIEETLLDIKEQIGLLARRDLEREASYSRLSSRMSDLENRTSRD